MVQEKILRQHGIKWHQLKITMVCSCGCCRTVLSLHALASQTAEQLLAQHFTLAFPEWASLVMIQ